MQPPAEPAHVGQVGGELAAPRTFTQCRDFARERNLERPRVARKDGVAMRDHRLQRFQIGVQLLAIELDPRRDLAHLGEAQHFQAAYVRPAEIELVPLQGQLRGRAVGVVVVVELFAADDDAPGDDVGARVLGRKIAIAPEVAQSVDDPRRRHRNPHHLDRPDRQSDWPEEEHIDNQHQPHALPAEARIDIALEPVVRGAGAVLLHGFLVLRFGAIQLGALKQDGADAARLRAVRIVGRLDEGMVFAMDRDPLLGDHSGGQPEPEAEEMADDGMQLQAAVRLGSMQEDRHCSNRDVRQREGEHDVTPPWHRKQAMREERQKSLIHLRGNPFGGGRARTSIVQLDWVYFTWF